MAQVPHIVEDDLSYIASLLKQAHSHAAQAWAREDAGDRRLKDVQKFMWDLYLGDYPQSFPVTREEATTFAELLAVVLGEDLRDANLERARRAPQPEVDPEVRERIERGKLVRKSLPSGDALPA